MGSEALDSYMEGSEEWSFFSQYMPAGVALSVASSEVSTAADERERKAARHAQAKGTAQQGKGANGGGQQNEPSRGSQPGAKRNQNQWGRGGSGAGSGAGSGGWGNWFAADDESSAVAKDVKALKETLEMVQKLVLRHEDAVNLLRLDYSFVAHMKLNVQAGVVPMLYVAADGWRKLKANEPQKLDRPMRASLFVCFLAELRSRLMALETNDTDIKKLTELGWLVRGPPLTWHFLKWDPTTQSNVVDKSKPPLSQAEVLEHIAILVKNVVGSNSLTRFHPTRPLTEEMRGDTLVFLIQVGLQGEQAELLRQGLKALCYNASLQLVASQLREGRPSRSNLANMVAAALPRGN